MMRRHIRISLLLLVLPAGVCRADLSSIDVAGFRVPEPPAEHPRLYLRARDLPDLRSRLTHPVLKPVWEEMQAAAGQSTQIRLEVAALHYLLDRDPEPGRRTVAETLELLRRAHLRFEV